MSVSKLRNKEESAFAAKKVQKKVEQQKPLTMAEALKERLARRNGYARLKRCSFCLRSVLNHLLCSGFV